MLHEQAIYQHDAGTWQVERFDYENHKAYVREVEPDYFTTAMTHTKVSILEEEAAAPQGTHLGAWGEVSVITKVVGYKQIKFQTHENTGYGEVHLPEMQMHTTSFWLKLGQDTKHIAPPAQRIDGLRGLGIALETIASFSLMCDPRDIGMTVEDERFVDDEEATLFLYEHVPGGTGLAERMFSLRKELFARALKLVTSCSCGAGCPACVGPAEISGERKRVAAALLEVLVSQT
jgi:DEAD/DEAH box helicase domain-containing protein